MGKEKKAFTIKEKIIGAIASTAIMAIPFMVAPAQQGYANIVIPIETPSVTPSITPSITPSVTPSVTPTIRATPVDKITTIVIPLNGTKYVDLDSLYSAQNMHVIQNEAELTIATGKFIVGNHGIYEINTSSVGKATFTVIGTRYEEQSYTQITDTFQVIVVPNTGNPDEFKFDISNVVNLMSQSSEQDQTNDQVVKGLLRNISPKTINNYDPFEYDSFNSAPYQLETTDKIHGFIGEPIHSWEIEQQIHNYFSDKNENMLDVIFIDKNNGNIQFEEKYDESGEILHGYDLTPLRTGDFGLNVLIVDHHGGLTKGRIPFHITKTENFILDAESSITIDLASYFTLNPNTNFDFNGASGHLTITGTKATFTPDLLAETYIISAINGDEREDRKFIVTPKDSLVNRKIILGSQLKLNLQSLLLPVPGSSVTYSVYLNNSSVTGLTYSIDHTNSLYFSSDSNAETNSPIDITVTAKDETNNVTIKDKMQISAIPLVKTDINRGFEVTQLFSSESEWNDVVVSSPFIKNGSPFGSYNTVYSDSNGTGSTVVTLNYKNELIFTVPFTYLPIR
ncbi:hypothetical protein [Paenibacillus sp. Soil787]|uniref:hypothetical protein n=1 Tax=Paenibacillus sp. Soil787 TaxID=1736411 RepID=UPI0006FA6851|nr:hypothetical protein [Paenibacillus sp. Soil787]KRF43455.1 hypothetical protein ASG93_00580 [Paenibacillus sp. Soil787]